MPSVNHQPLIIGFVADLIFAVKIEAAARHLNYDIVWIERIEQVMLPESHASVPARQPAEHLEGADDALLDKLTRLHPALVIVDLGNAQIPWRRWIPLIKSVPATRRIPLIAYGSHVDAETMRAAQSAGADAVLARSRFVQDLPALIQKYARIPDYDALAQACQQALSPLAVRGLELFNQGEYFESHELLEEAWNEDMSAGREVYRAILQVAVAYLQIERHNYNGAMKMFLRLRQWIDPLPDVCRGVDIAGLRADAETVHTYLRELGRERMAEFDRRLLRPVRYR